MLKQFKCTGCGTIDMLFGGTVGHLCNPCKVSKGLMPGRTLQDEAHYQVARSIRLGSLQRPHNLPCTDCGGASLHYDHRDYRKPLDVEPVCRKCNYKRGPALNG